MKARDCSPNASRWLFVTVLQILALLLLQSCKNDQSVREKAEIQAPHPRAVFGSAPERVPPATPPQASNTRPSGTPEVNRGEERARKADPVTPTPGPEANEPQRSAVADPGERRVAGDGTQIALKRPPREPAAERFLHYEPPASRVGDAGELADRSPEPQISTSMKAIRGLIRQWADTLLTRDLRGHMALYALTLNRFNGSSNVGRETVRTSKQALMSRLAGVTRFEMYDVRLIQRDESVVAEFRIESDIPGVVGWYRLELHQVSDRWEISGEEKLQPVSRRSLP